jgi:hypothetical protein
MMLSYFLLTNLSLCLFYLVYWLLLRRETYARWTKVRFVIPVKLIKEIC